MVDMVRKHYYFYPTKASKLKVRKSQTAGPCDLNVLQHTRFLLAQIWLHFQPGRRDNIVIGRSEIVVRLDCTVNTSRKVHMCCSMALKTKITKLPSF